MLTRTVHNLPFHSLDPGKFEELCLALVCREIDPNAQHLGAAGADEGWDIRAQVDGKVVCYQCKRYKRFGLSDAKDAIDTVMAGEEPPDEIVLVVSRDVSLTLRRDANAHSPVPCSFWARSELEERVWRHRDIRERFFGHIEPPPTQAPLWNIPQGVRFFTGRDTVLQELHQALTDTGQAALGQSLAVSGLGGIGKTQTAIAYAHEYRDAYTFAFWIAAENETTLRASFSEIAGILELPEVHEPEEDRMLAAVLRAWASREGGLLVFDNVEDPDLVKRFTPNPQTHHVVVTSRLQTLRRYGFPLLELPVLAPGDAVRFFHERTGRGAEEGTDEHQAAIDLAEEVGYLPLALEQAAAYIDTRAMGFESYLATYRKAGVEWIDRLEAVDHPESVLKTWNLNLQQVEEESPHSIELFHILAFLAPDDVPEFLFENVEGVGQPLEDSLAAHGAALDDLLEPLRRYSLIERDRGNASISVHRLVQDVARLAMSEGVQRDALRQAAVLVDRNFPDPEKLENWEVCEQLLAHGQNIEAKSRGIAENFLEAARLFYEAAGYCKERARYQEAEPLYTRSLRLYEAALGNDHPDVAQILNSLAILYQVQGRYENAEPLYERALKVVEIALGNDHLSVTSPLNNLAILYKEQGRFEEAEPLYLRDLRITEAALGSSHSSVAVTLDNLANLYSMQGRYEEAEPLYVRSLQIGEANLGNDHPAVAHTLNNLASLYQDEGRYGEAEPLYTLALQITEAALGNDHPNVAKILNGQAVLYRLQGRYEEAENLHLREIRITEMALGNDHPSVAKSINNLALLYSDQERYGEAEPLYIRALRIKEVALGNNHPSVAETLNNLAILYRSLDRHKEAEPLYIRALHIKEDALGNGHPSVAETLNNLAILYSDQGLYVKVEPLYIRALRIQETILGNRHPSVAFTLNNLANLYEVQGRYEDAEFLYTKAIGIYLDAVGPGHPNTATFVLNYENLLRKLDLHDEADALRQDFNQALAAQEPPTK